MHNFSDKIKPFLNRNVLFYSALFLLLFIISNLITSSTLFIFDISILKINIFLSFFVSMIIILFILRKRKINIYSIFSIIVLTLCIILSSITLSGKIYDYTCDGNTYHKTTIGMLVDGWNPLKESMTEFEETSDFNYHIIKSNYLWGEHYAKASHIFSANVSIVTDNIESGKSLNIISTIIVFLFVFSLILKLNKSKIFCLLFSAIVVSAPTISSQIFTNYVDILVYLYMFLLIYNFFAFEYEKEKSLEHFIIYFSTLVMLINIKFSSFGYAGIYCLGYYIWYMFRYKNSKSFFKLFTITSILSVLVGVFVVGLSVYPKNFLEHGHPFYPIMGKDKYDIMTSNQPDYFKEKSPIEKFTIATFSKADNIIEAMHTKAVYKVPFAIYQSELNVLYACDLRISGNGLLFSGILIISLLILFFGLFSTYKNDKKKFVLIIIPLSITLLLIFVMEDVWWARYFPQLHLVVIFSLLLLNSEKVIINIFKYIFIFIILFNNFSVLIYSTKFIYDYVKNVNTEYYVLKQNCEEGSKLVVDSGVYQGMYYNIRYKLSKYDIKISALSDTDVQYILNNGATKISCEVKE